ncbi:class I SAM-dependent methyltransferase [Streptomyces tubbatahanensis]|uniref:Class I SAM-dependent methyltransferase n=1 Tax=Streptomyces tubbatahanensis TaxID=2923272 RepID=A0ABY3Y278_9ACTN|nr:class I SAM-dependent methyltransferase [Streptomyces tubbatahanensis]UNT00692.1 class I SAM-dependent methyltransferase [Streptomyces tubbatahanensis]
MTDTSLTIDWQAWQTSWDRQQEWYMPDREERFRVMLEVVEAVAGPKPVVLDLACGPGSITARLLERLPGARSTALDLDPVLLSVAQGTFRDEHRVEFVTADLTDPRWPDALPRRPYDAVVTATALHWLTADALRVAYGRIAEVLREGGVFLNADHMRDDEAPRLNAALETHHAARKERELAAGAQDWRAWWTSVAQDPALAEQARRRFDLFGDPRQPKPGGDGRIREDRPVTTAWHLEALREAGFGEARRVWCSTSDAVLAALR